MEIELSSEMKKIRYEGAMEQAGVKEGGVNPRTGEIMYMADNPIKLEYLQVRMVAYFAGFNAAVTALRNEKEKGLQQ